MVGKINQSLDDVKICINTNQSFIIEAGAGSGKTWTLIESLRYIIETQGNQLEKTNKQIACITYTNVAKDEITHRIDNNSMVLVLTIHEFLWHVIKNFQKELKTEIVIYNTSDAKKHIDDLEDKLKKVNVDYSQYGRKFEKGRITHEDVLEFSSIIFNKYSKIGNIVANKFPFIFIDEYQDTEKRTIELLINNLLLGNRNKMLLGFFGDSMQKIYNQGIGKIPQEYIDKEVLKLITKNENYRCSKKVISLLGKIRPELIQEPTGKNLEGSTIFIHCNNKNDNEANYKTAIEYLTQKRGWDINDDTKILLLTHRGIATRLGYENILSLYNTRYFNTDGLLKKDEMFADLFLNKIEYLVKAFETKKHRDLITLLGIENFTVNKHDDKKHVNDLILSLIQLRENGTIKEVLDFSIEHQLVLKPSRLDDFLMNINKEILNENEEKDKVFYEGLLQIKYSELINIHSYIQNSTPFSTKHGVKGSEFNNVLVVIDDNSWNQFKFNDVFANDTVNQGRYDRTLNLFYVCCSRAKNNLAVLSLSGFNSKAMKTINEWAGEANVYDILNL